MTSTYQCDICNQTISVDKKLSVSPWDQRVAWDDICLDCWTNKKMWPKIHELKESLIY